MKKIIILNAPPNSGKDVAAAYMAEKFSYSHQEFKRKLFELTKAIYSISDEQWNKFYTRELKEVPSELLLGLTPRESLIYVSENIIKPNFSDEYFGNALATSINNTDSGVFIISDGGFISEIQPLIREFGTENIMIIRIHRDGCNFNKDSRNYLPDLPDICTIDLDNNQTLECFYNAVEVTISDFLQ